LLSVLIFNAEVELFNLTLSETFKTFEPYAFKSSEFLT